ncbi:MAG: YigZ family protein [Bacteroidales bacterium]|nr:YigZ family protein [Bacteroidales bacterium]
MLFEDTYKTINKQSVGVFKDRGSKFIGIAIPVISENDIKDMLETIRKKYYDATHHCYAYQLGFDKSAYRINDDGEPSGTAGKPIFGQILSNDLTNILIVVIRYYGGTKLGVPGLINAYKTSAAIALENSEIITKIVKEIYEIEYDYLAMNNVMKIIKEEKLEQLENIFDLKCKIVFAVRKNNSTKVYEKLKNVNSLSIRYLNIV